jgi:hypothetical protein
MSAYRGVDVWTHVFLTSPLVGGQLHAAAAFLPGKERQGKSPCTHWIGGLVNPRPGLDDMVK